MDTPNRVVFGYATTTTHDGRGQWQGEVNREGDDLVLRVRSHIRPSRWVVWAGLPVYRYLHSRAFRRGADHLAEQVLRPLPQAASPP